MKILKTLSVYILLLFVANASLSAQDPGWPRKLDQSGGTLVVYQPQVDEWKDYKAITWRQAFQLTPTGGKQVIGAATLTGNTIVDKDTHMVVIQDIQAIRTSFPSLDEANSAQMDQLFRTFLPPVVDISLERVVAYIPKPDSESVSTVQLKNDPPAIFVSSTPAILLAVDGEPALAKVPNTKLQFVVNTQWPVFLDSSKSYYLLVGERWLTAKDLKGPWTVAAKLPKEMDKLLKDEQWKGLQKVIPPPAQPSGPVPKIFYSTVPSEVILFEGKPVYAKIPQTQLVYATNTDSALLVFTPTNDYYFLAAGRWFRAKSLDGPWTFASLDLPPDFAKIPRSSPASALLSSVPGTEEAKDAVLIAQIPTVMEIDPKTAAAQAKVSYTGDPQFAPIEGTSLSYATNTADKVIKVGDIYYLCLQGVWFMSPNAQGPWTTASSVPKEIYTIPPSSPVYNVTYVTQTTTSSGNVECSHTAGYLGAFVMGVTVGAVVANGTGYYYPPYMYYPPYGYPVYRPYPVPYGYGSYYRTASGAYGAQVTAYGPYGSATRRASYNPYTGTYGRSATVATPYGSRSAGQAYNPYTGTYAATRQGSSPTAQWGQSYVSNGNRSAYTQHYSTAQGTVASGKGSQGGQVYAKSGASGTGAVGKSGSGDMYASKDGNVYKNTGEGWQKYDDGSWNTVNTPENQQKAQEQKASYQQQAQQKQANYQQGNATATQTSSTAAQQQKQGNQQQQRASSQPATATPAAQQRPQSADQPRPTSSASMESLNSEKQNRQRGSAESQSWQRSNAGGGLGGGGRSRASGGGGARRR